MMNGWQYGVWPAYECTPSSQCACQSPQPMCSSYEYVVPRCIMEPTAVEYTVFEFEEDLDMHNLTKNKRMPKRSPLSKEKVVNLDKPNLAKNKRLPKRSPLSNVKVVDLSSGKVLTKPKRRSAVHKYQSDEGYTVEEPDTD